MRDGPISRGGFSDHVLRDFSYAARTLARNPGFTIVAVLTLSAGMGALAAVFTLVNSILLRPLPYLEPDRIVTIGHTSAERGPEAQGSSTAQFFHYRTNATAFSNLALFEERLWNLSGDDETTQRVPVALAGVDLFRVLGVKPVLGRLFTPEDAAPGFMDLRWTIPVLLSHDVWRQRYGSDPGILGRIITLNQQKRIVVGVLPAEFAFPSTNIAIWMLFEPDASRPSVARSNFGIIGRLTDGVTVEQARSELARLVPELVSQFPEQATGVRPVVQTLQDDIVGERSTALWIVFAAMVFLLLVSCANVANLLLVRGNARRRELAVRTMLGASRKDLARLLLIECLLIAVAGSLLALAAATWGVRAAVSHLPVGLPRMHEVRVDGVVVLFVLFMCLLVTAGLGYVAMARSSRRRLTHVLKSGDRTGSDGREGRRVQNTLVSAQVAVSLVLLIGSGLMLQSFWRLTRVDPGFQSEGLLTVEVGLPYRKAPAHKRIYDELLNRIRALPGVVDASGATLLPLAQKDWRAPIVVEGSDEPDRNESVHFKFIMPGYFRIMHARVLAGTGFDEEEATPHASPVVISASLAGRLFPGESAIGRRIRRLESSGAEIPEQPYYTIAGVVSDIREVSLSDAPTDLVYMPVLEPRVDPWFSPPEMFMIVRSTVPPLSLAAAVRRIVRDYDPTLAVGEATTMQAVVDRSTAPTRFLAIMLLVCSATSLFLGSVGIYGVVSYTVRRRTREVGIRMALGADARRVVTMVMREAFVLTAVGALAGIGGALVLTRVLRSMLFQISPTDPLTFVLFASVICLTALAASYIPAHRAALTSPSESLRVE